MKKGDPRSVEKMRKEISKKIEGELNSRTFCGYSGSTNFLKFDQEKFIDMCAGELLMLLGRGDFREGVANVISMSAAYHDYRAVKYD